MFTYLRDTIHRHHARHLTLASKHRALRALPPNVYDYWRTHARTEFSGIPTDAVFFTRAAEGLMQYFACVAHAKTTCALPSKAADSVWHAWLALDAEGLRQFCIKWFGRPIPHVEAAALELSLDNALANTLVASRHLEGVPILGRQLPALFDLDARLRMPHGFGYRAHAGAIEFSPLDAHGHAHVWRPHGALLPIALLSFGLISSTAYADYANTVAAAKQRDSSSGSGCGSGWSGNDPGAGSSDSSCGSGCGGGCG